MGTSVTTSSCHSGTAKPQKPRQETKETFGTSGTSHQTSVPLFSSLQRCRGTNPAVPGGAGFPGGMSAASRQCLEPDPRWGYKARSCAGLRGGCRVSLTHADGRLGHSPQEQGGWNWRCSCCLPRWSRLCCARAAPRGPYIQGKGVGEKAAAKGGAIAPKPLGGARPALWLVSALLTTDLEGKSAAPCRSFP